MAPYNMYTKGYSALSPKIRLHSRLMGLVCSWFSPRSKGGGDLWVFSFSSFYKSNISKFQFNVDREYICENAWTDLYKCGFRLTTMTTNRWVLFRIQDTLVLTCFQITQSLGQYGFPIKIPQFLNLNMLLSHHVWCFT